MGCGVACGTKGGGCSSGGCSTGGCNKLNVYDWLADMELPPSMRPFDVVEVSFKGNRKSFYRNIHHLDLYKEEPVVVEVETGGYDIGRVSVKGELVKLQLKKAGVSEDDERIKKIYRVATEADLAKWQECKDLEIPTQYKARSFAIELGLDMKLSDVEYQADRRKAVFFYTAEARVDFRELIKRLADAFKIKIEMRQISYREEAGRLGGIGSCGRTLCCSTWLTDFKQVNTGAARYQNLSLNQLKLSGQCGRLKCCLNYELDTYVEALQEFPKDDKLTIELETGRAILQKTDILRRIMLFTVIGGDSNNWISLPVQKVKELMEMNARGEKPAMLSEYSNEKEIAVEEPDYKDMVGEDSITRLDRPKKNKSRNNNRNNNSRDNKETRGGDNRERRVAGNQERPNTSISTPDPNRKEKSPQNREEQKNRNERPPNTPHQNKPNTNRKNNPPNNQNKNNNRGSNPNAPKRNDRNLPKPPTE
jgi:cell fate regulator YaaT (PSP1 superfamily)